MVAPGGGFVITAAAGAVCSGAMAVPPVPPPDPVSVSVAFVPAEHAVVETETVACAALVCVGDPFTVIVGAPRTVAHVPVCFANVTVPPKLAEPFTRYVAVLAVCDKSDAHIDSALVVWTVRVMGENVVVERLGLCP